MSNERIILKNISVYGHLGVTEKEKSKRQKIQINIKIELTTSFSMLNDSIDNTVNYSLVRKQVKKLFRKENFNLLETAALRIAQLIKENHSCKRVEVTVKKFPYRDIEYVACTITL